jgi:hypothetical protein
VPSQDKSQNDPFDDQLQSDDNLDQVASEEQAIETNASQTEDCKQHDEGNG